MPQLMKFSLTFLRNRVYARYAANNQIQKRYQAITKSNYKLEKLKLVIKMIVEEVPLPEEEYRAHLLEPTKDYHNCWECQF